MKERVLYLDILRVLACVMVIMMHAPMSSANANGLFTVTLTYFTMPCIGLFFAVSGALLMPIIPPPHWQYKLAKEET